MTEAAKTDKIQEIINEIKSVLGGGLNALESKAYSHNFILNVLNGCERLTKELERAHKVEDVSKKRLKADDVLLSGMSLRELSDENLLRLKNDEDNTESTQFIIMKEYNARLVRGGETRVPVKKPKVIDFLHNIR